MLCCASPVRNRGSLKPVSHLQLLCDLLHLECGTWVIVDGDDLFFANLISSLFPFFSTMFLRHQKLQTEVNLLSYRGQCTTKLVAQQTHVVCQQLFNGFVIGFERWLLICSIETVALVLVDRKPSLFYSSMAGSHCCSSGVR